MRIQLEIVRSANMRVFLKPILALLLTAPVLSSASPTLSDLSVRSVHEAISEAAHGNRDRALATFDGILMSRGLTIGCAGTTENVEAVKKGIESWRRRMADCPIQFVKESPDISVAFVSDISAGGDVQGQVLCHRQVFWGHAGTGYEISGEILIKANVRGRPLTSDEISGVTAHEIGHVLGLDDDPSLNHVMGRFVPGHPVDGPSEAEVQRVESFRAAVRRTELEVGGIESLGDRASAHRGHRILRKRKVGVPALVPELSWRNQI